MSKEVLANPEIDGKDSRKSTIIIPKTREYKLLKKIVIGERLNPAGRNGTEKLYQVEILQIKTNRVKKLSNLAWFEDNDETLKELFYGN
jgi:hypothetical protein